MTNKVDVNQQGGFSLVELVCVLILTGLLTLALFSRFTSPSAAKIQTARDDIVAALFFAQQTSMARSVITLVVTANAVSVKENGTPIVVDKYGYPLSFPTGVTAVPVTFTYDKLGHTTAGTITVSDATGVSATIYVQVSGYAY